MNANAGGRQNIGSGNPIEAQAGYSRAVRVGNQVWVAGTAALPGGQIAAPGDPAEQTRVILGIIERALAEAGANLADVVRYRVFVTDLDRWQEVAAVLGERFQGIDPAGTLVGTSGLIHPDLTVEIEVDAVILG